MNWQNGLANFSKMKGDGNMNRTYLFMLLYQGLWLSPDFENDLQKNFPKAFKALKQNTNKISTEELDEMIDFMNNYPVFI